MKILAFLASLFSVMSSYARMGVLSVAPSSFTSQPQTFVAGPLAIEAQGANDNLGSQAAFFAALVSNAAPQTGYCNYKSIATSASVTLNVANLPLGIGAAIVLWTGSTATTATLDSTANIIAGLPGAYVGMQTPFWFANASTQTVTLAVGDANTTLSGTTTNVTLALRGYQLTVTNLAQPSLTTPNVASPLAPGATSTNTTTTTAAVAAGTPSLTTTTVVIPVAATTGMIANQSVLQVVQTDGSVFVGLIPTGGISGNNITVNGVNAKPIASGASVYVWNPKITVQGMFSITGAALVA